MLRNKVSTLEEYQDKFNVLDRRHNSSLSEIHNLKKDLNEGKKNFDVLQKEFFNCRENRSKAEAKNTKLDYELKELIDNFKILESNNINSQNLLVAPITFVLRTALSVLISTNNSTLCSFAIRVKLYVPKTLISTPSHGIDSTIGTCLYAAA